MTTPDKDYYIKLKLCGTEFIGNIDHNDYSKLIGDTANRNGYEITAFNTRSEVIDSEALIRVFNLTSISDIDVEVDKSKFTTKIKGYIQAIHLSSTICQISLLIVENK